MAMTPEAKVKRKVSTILRNLNAYYFYPVTGGYGTSGVPDIVGCYRGLFFGIECKAGRNKPTPLQQLALDNISKQGGIAMVIREDNIGKVVEKLTNTGLDGKQ